MAVTETIKYNGVWLERIAPGIKIEDITVTPIQLSQVTRERETGFGSDFIRSKGARRRVIISFALPIDDREERENQLQAIRDWALTDGEYTLVLPHFSDRHLEAVCTSLPESSYRQWWQDKMRIEFSCYSNPYWTSDELVEVQCGEVFSISGSAPPIMTIERRLITPAMNQSYVSGSQVMQFTQIPAGNMVIDLNRQTAAIGGGSFMRYFVPTSQFLTPAVGGRQRISGVGTIRYRERWV